MGPAPVLVRTAVVTAARQVDSGCAHTDAAARFFRALSDPTRLKLLEFILRGERTCPECVGYAGVSQSRVSVQLACLTACGYVTGHRDGRRMRYRVGDPGWRTWSSSPAPSLRTTTASRTAAPVITPSRDRCSEGTAMPTSDQPPRREPDRPGMGSAPGIGIVLLMIACCALPVLVLSGALAGIGAWLGNPWVIAAAVVLAVAAVTVLVRRRARRDDCCPPGDAWGTAATRHREPRRGSGPHDR
jgi:Predicted transcriptional regulators